MVVVVLEPIGRGPAAGAQRERAGRHAVDDVGAARIRVRPGADAPGRQGTGVHVQVRNRAAVAVDDRAGDGAAQHEREVDPRCRPAGWCRDLDGEGRVRRARVAAGRTVVVHADVVGAGGASRRDLQPEARRQPGDPEGPVRHSGGATDVAVGRRELVHVDDGAGQALAWIVIAAGVGVVVDASFERARGREIEVHDAGEWIGDRAARHDRHRVGVVREERVQVVFAHVHAVWIRNPHAVRPGRDAGDQVLARRVGPLAEPEHVEVDGVHVDVDVRERRSGPLVPHDAGDAATEDEREVDAGDAGLGDVHLGRQAALERAERRRPVLARERRALRLRRHSIDAGRDPVDHVVAGGATSAPRPFSTQDGLRAHTRAHGRLVRILDAVVVRVEVHAAADLGPLHEAEVDVGNILGHAGRLGHDNREGGVLAERVRPVHAHVVPLVGLDPDLVHPGGQAAQLVLSARVG